MTFQPAFEVTHVDSMQWNRTCFLGRTTTNETPAAALPPLSPDVLARVQEAVRAETAHARA
jgi:hypothetical protein